MDEEAVFAFGLAQQRTLVLAFTDTLLWGKDTVYITLRRLTHTHTL